MSGKKLSSEIRWGYDYSTEPPCFRNINLQLPKTAPIFTSKQYQKVTQDKPKTCQSTNIPYQTKISPRSKTVNRYLLSGKQYLKFLAQPKRVVSNILKPYKKPLLCCSPRLISLSLPHKRKIFGNWQDYHNILPIYKIEKLISFLDRGSGEMSIIDTFTCKKKTCTRNRFRRNFSCTRNKRKSSQADDFMKLQSLDIAYFFANYLMKSRKQLVLSEYPRKIFLKILSFLIEKKLWKYECRKLTSDAVEMDFIQVVNACSVIVCCILMQVEAIDCHNHSTVSSSISTSSRDAKLPMTESNEDSSDNNDVDKKSKKSKTSRSSSRRNQSISSVKSQKIVDNTSSMLTKTDLNISEQTGETDQMKPTTPKDSSTVVDCEQNIKLLSAIRQFYNKRTDLYDKHIFDDTSLPKVTLKEVMEKIELVMNQKPNVLSEESTSELQRAFLVKITEWVNEITSEEWDDCMKADLKLLSHELAKVISEYGKDGLEPPSGDVNLEETKTITTIFEKNPIGTIQKKIPSQIDIRGVDLNVHHMLDITPHAPGTVCCASLKIWSAWIKDVASNAKLWCIWINQIISNMQCLSAIMRGEVYDNEGVQLNLVRCDWKEFICNLDQDIAAWRSYNTHVQALTEEVTTYFHGKSIICCPLCKKENLSLTEIGVEHLCKQLFESMQTTKQWRHWLQDIVNEAEMCIYENNCFGDIPELDEITTNTEVCLRDPYQQALIEKDPSIYSIDIIDPQYY